MGKGTGFWLFVPGPKEEAPPLTASGLEVTFSWSSVLDAVRREQADRKRLRVAVYPCAPLQVLDRDPRG
jgi:hypothetical protein